MYWTVHNQTVAAFDSLIDYAQAAGAAKAYVEAARLEPGAADAREVKSTHVQSEPASFQPEKVFT